MEGWIKQLQSWARTLKFDLLALWIAARDDRTPWVAKLTAGAVAAYALSPIDLIPDFIPVLGHLDDLIIVPLGMRLAIRLIPPPLMAEFRALAATQDKRPSSRAAAAAVVFVWLSSSALLAYWLCWKVRQPPI